MQGVSRICMCTFPPDAFEPKDILPAIILTQGLFNTAV